MENKLSFVFFVVEIPLIFTCSQEHLLHPLSWQHYPLLTFCYFTWAIVLASCSITPNSTIGLSHVGYTWWAPPPATPRPSSSPTWSSSHQLNSLSLPLSSIPGKTFIRKYCLLKKNIVSQVQTISILVPPTFILNILINSHWVILSVSLANSYPLKVRQCITMIYCAKLGMMFCWMQLCTANRVTTS